MRRVYAQAIKELQQFWRDRLTVGLAFFLPAATLIMFGFVTRLEAKGIPLAVLSFDAGKLSRDYIHTLLENGQVRMVRAQGNNPIVPLDSGAAQGTMVIPPEFSRRLKQGLAASVQLAIDASDVNNARIIKNGVLATTSFFARSYGLVQGAPLIRPQVRIWFNPGRKEALHIVPGALGLVLWIFPSLLAALALSREKEQGTMLQLYASSLTSHELILGKALAYLVIGLGEAVVLIAVAVLIFDLRFVGQVMPFLVSTVLYVLASVLFGLLSGARTNTQTAALQLVATVGFTTALLLSGFIYPVRNIVYPLNLLSNVIPARYYIESCRDVFVRGGDWTAHWYIPGILALAALFFFLVSSRLMSRMQLTS